MDVLLQKQDIYAFIESLKDVFKQASHFYLLKSKLHMSLYYMCTQWLTGSVTDSYHAELHSFLLEKHKETFALFYCEFTGRELDHQPPLHRLHGTLILSVIMHYY